jgi:hypothetical protein
MCIGLPQLVTGLDVKKRQAEKDHGEQQHDGILHAKNSQLPFALMRARADTANGTGPPAMFESQRRQSVPHAQSRIGFRSSDYLY